MFRDKPWRWPLLLALVLAVFYVLEVMKLEQASDQASDQAIAEDSTEAGGEKTKRERKLHAPDFAAITDVKEKKQTFFDYFYPLVVEENQRILDERKIVLTKDRNSTAVKRLCRKYSRDCDEVSREQKKLLLKRIDVVPPALVLAQAAKESGWGTSRFALEANNYFGQWCYTKGCGLVPAGRIEGAKHEVRNFDSPQQAVRSYLFNLNTGRVYGDLRQMRLEARAKGETFSSYELAGSLLYYSERREAYVEEVQSLISFNKLEAYDKAFWQSIK